LTQWVAGGNALRAEASLQRDLLSATASTLQRARQTHHERRVQDLRSFEQTIEATQNRWNERLRRLDEWQGTLDSLGTQRKNLEGIMQSIHWFRKALERHQGSFLRRFQQRIRSLQSQAQPLHQALNRWSAALQEHLALLTGHFDNRPNRETLLVSRARKRPEVEFLQAQQATAEQLGKELRELRRSLNNALGRLQKARQTVDQRAAFSEVRFEIHKQSIHRALEPLALALQEQRESILSDALAYESCCRHLLKLQEMVQSLRCIEDVYPPTMPRWKAFFKRR
jgi:DNA repair exonuclease SbcCD ATPase subunit